ncbi:MAG: VOC family protein [Acidimicrobiales bacterium]
MSITGVHALLYSSEPEALRSLLVDVLGLGHVDDGQDQGWLIFKLPPAEVGVHPSDGPSHELSLMCDDLGATIEELKAKGVVFESDPVDEGWGIAVKMILPGDVKMLLYQPRHNTAI